jgi:hypothetical protein
VSYPCGNTEGARGPGSGRITPATGVKLGEGYHAGGSVFVYTVSDGGIALPLRQSSSDDTEAVHNLGCIRGLLADARGPAYWYGSADHPAELPIMTGRKVAVP